MLFLLAVFMLAMFMLGEWERSARRKKLAKLTTYAPAEYPRRGGVGNRGNVGGCGLIQESRSAPGVLAERPTLEGNIF